MDCRPARWGVRVAGRYAGYMGERYSRTARVEGVPVGVVGCWGYGYGIHPPQGYPGFARRRRGNSGRAFVSVLEKHQDALIEAFAEYEREYQAAYYEAHAEYERETARTYRAEHPD